MRVQHTRVHQVVRLACDGARLSLVRRGSAAVFYMHSLTLCRDHRSTWQSCQFDESAQSCQVSTTATQHSHNGCHHNHEPLHPAVSLVKASHRGRKQHAKPVRFDDCRCEPQQLRTLHTRKLTHKAALQKENKELQERLDPELETWSKVRGDASHTAAAAAYSPLSLVV